MIHLLSGPIESKGLRQQYYKGLIEDANNDSKVSEIIRFHMLDTNSVDKSTDERILTLFKDINPDPAMPDQDEIVEDAGLFDHEYNNARQSQQNHKKAVS